MIPLSRAAHPSPPTRRLAVLALLVTPGCGWLAVPTPPPESTAIRIEGAGGTTLGGTLAVPAAPGMHPGLLLVGGAAERDRDQVLAGFASFEVLARELGRAGIATLRTDDRGTGESRGSTRRATLDDLAGDAQAGVEALASSSRVAADQIGVLAHGDGARVAARLAARDPRVAFVVLLAGACAPTRDQWLHALAQELRLRGADAARRTAGERAVAAFLDDVIAGRATDGAARSLRELALGDLAALPDADPRRAEPDSFVAASFEGRLLAAAESEGFRAHAASDPADDLANVRVPVLALFGGRDLVVDGDRSEAALRASLPAGASLQVVRLDDATHTFQPARTGAPDEYALLPHRFVDGMIECIAGWVDALPARPGDG